MSPVKRYAPHRNTETRCSDPVSSASGSERKSSCRTQFTRLVGDEMIRATAHQSQIAWPQLDRAARTVDPEPRGALHDGVDRQLDRTR